MKNFNALIALTSLMATLLSSGAAFAHSDEYLDTQKTPHGGQLRMAGAYHYELVVTKDSKEAKVNPVIVYLTDHAGTKVPAAGTTGTVTLLSGKTKTSVTLAPGGDNRLKGSGKYASSPDMKAIVSITLPGKAPEQARFTPLAQTAAVAQDGHAEHKH